MQRTRAHRGHKSTQWVLAQVGLQVYEQDSGEGLRHWGRRDTEDWNHDQREEPSFPLLGHGNVIWMFHNSADVSSTSWDIAEAGAGTQLALQDELGGVAKGILGGNDNDLQYYRSIAELLEIPTLGGVVTFRTKIRILDVDQCDLFIGFCERVAGSLVFTARQNAIGWYLSDGGGGRLNCETTASGTPTQNGPTTDLDGLAIPVVVNDEWIELAFSIQIAENSARSAVNFFKNGQYMITHTTNIPTNAMAFTFALRNGEAVANEISITTTALLISNAP